MFPNTIKKEHFQIAWNSQGSHLWPMVPQKRYDKKKSQKVYFEVGKIEDACGGRQLAQLSLYLKAPTYAHGDVTVFEHMPERCDSAGILFALRQKTHTR